MNIKSPEKCLGCGRFITIYRFGNYRKTWTFQNKNKEGGYLLQIPDVDAVNETQFIF